MYNHETKNYLCPICLGVQGIENENTLLLQNDLIYKDTLVTAFINSFFIPGNEGHVIVVPNQHVENIYDLPQEYAHAIIETSQKIAIALKRVYQCDGITLLQNNEPAGNQHAFHYHQHIFPRYSHDRLYEQMLNKRLATPEERLKFAERIKDKLGYT